MHNDKPKCPVCGRDMIGCKFDTWGCTHRDDGDMDIWADGAYCGPSRDPDGSKVRAQIAAIEQRIHDAHPHTHGDTEPASEPAPSKPATCGEWWRTGTCGECAWSYSMPADVADACRRHPAINFVLPDTPACPAGVRRGE